MRFIVLKSSLSRFSEPRGISQVGWGDLGAPFGVERGSTSTRQQSKDKHDCWATEYMVGWGRGRGTSLGISLGSQSYSSILCSKQRQLPLSSSLHLPAPPYPAFLAVSPQAVVALWRQVAGDCGLIALFYASDRQCSSWSWLCESSRASGPCSHWISCTKWALAIPGHFNCGWNWLDV